MSVICRQKKKAMFTYVIWYNNYSGGMPASSADSVRLNLNTKQEVGLYEKKIQALCASLFMGILLFMAGVQTFAGPSYTSKFF